MAKQKTDLQVFQEWVQDLSDFVFGKEEKPKPKKRKRARKKDGTFSYTKDAGNLEPVTIQSVEDNCFEDIEKIYYFPVPDYGRSISDIDTDFRKKKIDITVIKDKFLSKSAFLDLLSKCNVFIAPRKKEGIGMTIVEAISKGMFVFGFNDSTMDEYIENDFLGFLFVVITACVILIITRLPLL